MQMRPNVNVLERFGIHPSLDFLPGDRVGLGLKQLLIPIDSAFRCLVWRPRILVLILEVELPLEFLGGITVHELFELDVISDVACPAISPYVTAKVVTENLEHFTHEFLAGVLAFIKHLWRR